MSYRRPRTNRPVDRAAALPWIAVATALALAVLPAYVATADPSPGWQRLPLPGGSYAERYIPEGVTLPAPTVLFLHGAGGYPGPYMIHLEPAADAAGMVVIAPRSATDLGWGFSDDTRILSEALEAVEEEGSAHLDHLTVAGHSSGGAYAFLLTYQAGLPARAVFALASPFYPVFEPLPTQPAPPIRMYYGKNDPNFTGGSYQRLADQWSRLGVPWEADLQAGYGHSTWPTGTVEAGFAFLAEAAGVPATGVVGDCVPSETTLCLEGGRYQVEVAWQDHAGATGPGRIVPGLGAAGDPAAANSGLFWFFRPANWELMVKVLDGCATNGHRWVFSAATTDVAYTLTVLDTETLEEWRHDNIAGQPAPAVTDTTAFPCAP